MYIVGYVLKIKPINSFSWKSPKQSTTRIFLSLRGYYWQQTNPTIISSFLSKRYAASFLLFKKTHFDLRHRLKNKFLLMMSKN